MRDISPYYDLAPFALVVVITTPTVFWCSWDGADRNQGGGRTAVVEGEC